ncbi:MAG TPA: ATP-binding protein [Acidimicrobiales bacterium]|nr:ATP-binding protein [Acidimicrobiales bacterium]
MASLPRGNLFPGEPASVAAARRFATEAVAGVHPDLCDAARLLVSELATNAVRHGRSAYAVHVVPLPTGVRVEVSDGGADWTTGDGGPAEAGGAPTDLGGRGLKIVEGLAETWGVLAREGPGKVVWFELRASGGAGRR